MPDSFSFVKCPITGDNIQYSEFANDALHPTHGRSAFQVGHLNPLKSSDTDGFYGHTADNISWISENGNRNLKSKTDAGSWVLEAVNALRNADLEQFRKQLTSFLADIPYSMRRKEDEREKERYFHYTFYLLMRMVSCYTVYTEKQQSEGRVDCIIETPNYIYVFEFKLNGTADEAMKQIEDKGYVRPYEADKRKLFKVGVVFSSETGTISDFKVS